jgi:hypothetical protein
MMPFGKKSKRNAAPQARVRSASDGVPADVVIDQRATAYPRLRRAISDHLRDVADFVDTDQPTAARHSPQMALAIRSEIEVVRTDLI